MEGGEGGVKERRRRHTLYKVKGITDVTERRQSVCVRQTERRLTIGGTSKDH